MKQNSPGKPSRISDPFLLNGLWDSGFDSEARLNRMEGFDAEGRGQIQQALLNMNVSFLKEYPKQLNS